MANANKAHFEVGQQVRVIANPTDEFFKAMSGMETTMHGLEVGSVTTVTMIKEDYGDMRIGISTEGFEFDRELFSDGTHFVEPGWIEAI